VRPPNGKVASETSVDWDGGTRDLVAFQLALEPAEVVGDQDCGTVCGHGVGLQEDVRENEAVGGEPGTYLLLEGSQSTVRWP
jgi:hypothetical protein